MTILYKKDNTGKIRVWEVEADFDQMIIRHGVMHGALVEKVVPVHINKSGRCLEDQLELEMNSRINKQLDMGYSLDITQANSKEMTNALELPLPMLAQPVNKVKSKDKILFQQYKYDGMRCLIHHGPSGLVAYSRGGKPIETIKHITNELVIPEGATVDGELYIHDTSLQSIMSLAKRYQPATRELNYIIYDIVMPVGYKKRLREVKAIANASGPSVRVAPTSLLVRSLSDELEEAQRMGYEGLILRDSHTPYQAGKRSTSLIKVKSVEDEIFVIEDITSSKDGHAILHCGVFSVIAPGNHAFKSHVLINADNFIGKEVRVEYANKTKDGVPFHPVATNIVDD